MRYLPLLFVFSPILGGISLRADDFSNSVEQVGKTPAPATVTPAPVVATVPEDDHTVSSDEPGVARTRQPGLQSGIQPEPEVVQDRREVARLEQAGDREAARQYALEALARNPKDKDLNAFVKLTAPVEAAVGAKTMKANADALESGTRQDEVAGGAILALPINIVGLGGVAAPPSAPPGAASRPAGAGPDFESDVALVHSLTRAAETKLNLGDPAGAERLLTRRLEENPSDLTALHRRAWARRVMKQYDSSAEDAGRILALTPMDMRALLILVQNLLDLERREEAQEAADRAIADYPRSAHAFVARAAVSESQGRHVEKLVYLKQAAALDPQFLASLYAAQREDDERQRAELKGVAGSPARPRSLIFWLAAIGTALLFFSFTLLPKLWSADKSEARLADRAAAAADIRSSVPAGYSLGQRLGQGGMGVVYEGEDRALRRKVAIKILRPEVAASPRERNRFLKEARTVAKLKHPNIVDIHSVHDENGEVWLVFEHVKGESLHEALGRGKFPVPKALNFLGQVAAALDYAHGQGVVHQDLKPANIMADGDVAKVMDFGIARCIRETLSTMSKIEVSGTPAYMAPEQELGGAAVGPAADIFAFGACAYECLSGQTPFPAGFVMIKVEKRYQLLSQVSELPPAVDAVIARALEPEPAKRWPTAAVFVAALAQALQVPQAVHRGT